MLSKMLRRYWRPGALTGRILAQLRGILGEFNEAKVTAEEG